MLFFKCIARCFQLTHLRFELRQPVAVLLVLLPGMGHITARRGQLSGELILLRIQLSILHLQLFMAMLLLLLQPVALGQQIFQACCPRPGSGKPIVHEQGA